MDKTEKRYSWLILLGNNCRNFLHCSGQLCLLNTTLYKWYWSGTCQVSLCMAENLKNCKWFFNFNDKDVNFMFANYIKSWRILNSNWFSWIDFLHINYKQVKFSNNIKYKVVCLWNSWLVSLVYLICCSPIKHRNSKQLHLKFKIQH